MSGILTIRSGINRTVKVISKANSNEEVFVIPNDEDYQLILQEDCKIRITNNTVETFRFVLITDTNSNITMKVLKMSSNETNLSNRFYNNKWLKSFNHNVRDNWDNVTYMGDMFRDCANLTSATLPNTLPNVTSMASMFSYCTNLTSVTLPSELPKVTDISYMFRDCTSFNGNLSNTKFKSNVFRYEYDSNTPLWLAVNKPQFTL